jgi:MFS family permease
MSAQNRPISRISIGYLTASIAAGVLASVWCQPLVHENKDAHDVIVVLFSILAGFLVAIMTIVGDPATYRTTAWKTHERIRETIFARLARQKWLFYLYIVTLGLLFASVLAGKRYPQITIWTEYVYVGLAVAAFFLSLRLPAMLMSIQLDRHDEIIEEKRKTESVPSSLGDN